jgi:hypothetical protein
MRFSTSTILALFALTASVLAAPAPTPEAAPDALAAAAALGASFASSPTVALHPQLTSTSSILRKDLFKII